MQLSLNWTVLALLCSALCCCYQAMLPSIFHRFLRRTDGKSTAMIMTSSFSSFHHAVPDNLRKFLKEGASWSLETWSSPSLHLTAKAVDHIVESVILDTQADCSLEPFPPTSSIFLRELSKKAKRSFKMIRGMADANISLILEEDSGNVIKTLRQREEHKLKGSNKRMFRTIANHHTNIKSKGKLQNDQMTSKSVKSVDNNNDDSMEDDWVINLSEWMANFTVSYFMKGGAKKSYIRDIRQRNQLQYKEYQTVYEALPNDLIPSHEIIKVLHIGSHHNHLQRSSFQQYIDVTTIDHDFDDVSDVYKCDFFDVNIGDKHSEMQFSEHGKEVIQLPADSFDVVAISLVLSNLSTSKLRIQMIEKARKLLRKESPCQDKMQTPHYEGLLLITEKSSSFPLKEASTTNLDEHLPLLHEWKTGIKKLGFDLVKHGVIPYARNSHSFAFKTACTSISSSESGGQMVNLWTKDDFCIDSASKTYEFDGNNCTNDLMTVTPVSIIGGGIGGAALALALKMRNIPYLLFEKDEDINVRKQGYGLTLQQSVSSLKALGIDRKELLQHGVVSSSHFSYSSTGELIGQYGKARKLENPVILFTNKKDVCIDKKRRVDVENVNGSHRHNIHIGRQKLRELLIERLDVNSIRWGKKLESYDEVHSSGQQQILLKFDDGSVQWSHVVVAADGIYSNLRQMKSLETDKLRYLGVVVILGISEGVISEASSGDRIQVQWLDGKTRVFCMPFDKNHTMWQLSFPVEDEAEAKKISATPASLQQKALDLCSLWPYPLSDLVKSTLKSDVSGHPVYDREILQYGSSEVQKLNDVNQAYDIIDKYECKDVHYKKERSKITFLGDAAHPMSPFKGQGANQAIIDAVVLARALYSSNLLQPRKQSLDEALCQYEQEMLERSSSKVLKSRSAAKYLHSEGALAVANVTRASAAAMKEGVKGE